MKVMANKPVSLCADYRSASDSDTCDSDPDSSSSDSESLEESEEESDDSNTKGKKKSAPKEKPSDLQLSDLPPIEDLQISVPEDKCEEIGIVSSIVDTLVVIESYKGSDTLDIDSVLFLDKGKRALGRIFDVLGPVKEPVYTVRFSSVQQISEKNVTQGMKVYFAPKTEHTSFVFVAHLLKYKGSDASWKDNREVPVECQDFSDDEEEERYKNSLKKKGGKKRPNENNKRIFDPLQKNLKRSINDKQQPGRFIHPTRFQGPANCQRPVNKFTQNTSKQFIPRASSSHTNQAFVPLNAFLPQPPPFTTAPPYYPGQRYGGYGYNVPPFPDMRFQTPPPPLGAQIRPIHGIYDQPVPVFPFNQGPQQQCFPPFYNLPGNAAQGPRQRVPPMLISPGQNQPPRGPPPPPPPPPV